MPTNVQRGGWDQDEQVQADLLAASIRDYWQRQGYEVDVKVVMDFLRRGNATQKFFKIETDLINGLPKGFKKHGRFL